MKNKNLVYTATVVSGALIGLVVEGFILTSKTKK